MKVGGEERAAGQDGDKIGGDRSEEDGRMGIPECGAGERGGGWVGAVGGGPWRNPQCGREVGGDEPEDGDEVDEQGNEWVNADGGGPGRGPCSCCRETGAALLGRRVRVVWPAEGTSFDGTVHSWSPVDGQHEVQYDDGDVQWHVLSAEQVEWLSQEQEQQPQEGVSPASPPCVEGLVEGAEDAGAGEDGGPVGGLPPVVAVDVAAVGTPQSNSRPDPTDGLESPPVPEGLVGLLGTPDGPSGERDDPLGVDGVASPGSAGPDAPQLGAPRPSPGMERQRFVGPLFRPFEGEWYGHVMRSMPPTGIIRDGVATTFSWFFCPLILDAVGWESAFPNLPRDAGWNEMVSELARVLQEAGITWEVVAGYILEEGMHPFHFSRQRQEQLIQMDQQLGQEVQMFASGLVASARLLETGRGLVGSTGGPSGAGRRAPVQPSSPSRTRAASQPLPERRADTQRGGPCPSSQPAASRHSAASHRQQQRQAGGSGGVPRTFLSSVAEACDGPVVEDETSSGGAGTPGGEHALLDACALEALLRGEAGGADTFTHHQSFLSRNLADDELDGETLEALRDLHPAGDGLPGRVQAAPLELENAAVEAECRRFPVASGPGQMRTRWATYFSPPPLEGASSSAAQLGVGVPSGAEEAGITWEVVAGYILEEGMHPFHFSGQRQEQLIQMDQQLGQEAAPGLAW
ncbi:hypothetical protein CYMTET_32281 [Cymbomonas tetramitiformis]|uniref:Uncharacterized protein n=1 Tax=Cymbomonas tetramitiformis TaxID=36881 RepID=A0AAE0FFC0_9CHLO|nr:hypothetical protein CYMTET_32281 [Cymbomonas tetramitiformis]